MAGVVTMASIIEDFDMQPCKKSRKDVTSPVVKTITNYFSPVAKPTEKPFSPPRSNNIMDYFNKKAPLSKEKTNIPEQSKENCRRPPSVEKQSSPLVEKPASQKRGRKSSKTARKLVVAESVESNKDESCEIIEELCKSKDTEVAHVSTMGVFGSDTAALLAQANAEISPAKANSHDKAKKVDLHETGESCKKIESVPNIIELSPILPSRNKPKLVKTCAQKVKKRLHEKKHPEPKENEAESSLCDASMEVNLDEASQLNSSTVTVSFEEFVRSQSREEDSEEDDEDNQGKTAVTTELEDVDAKALESPKAGENMSSGEPSDQVSPTTMSIRAEVHTVSPRQEEVSSTGKLAPIFKRKKVANSPTEVTSSPQAEIKQMPPSIKRKSNVVLLEEDLELVVIESESTPKCSDVEKKQFMAAFKQPNMDVTKGKAVKSQTKQKQPEEENIEAVDEGLKELCADKVSQSSPDNKKPTKKPMKKQKNGTKATKKEKRTISPPAEDMDTIVIEDDNKNKEPLSLPTNTPTLRRSRRERPINAPEASPSPPVRTTRRNNDSKPLSDVTQDSPVPMSTPKIRRSKRGLFVAQMVCAPDSKGSPIRMKLTRVTEGVSPSKSKSKKFKSPLTKKMTDDVRKRKQAKKLVEESKVIQRKKTCEEKVGVRRSSRSEAAIKKSYCENEDMIICVEDDQKKTPLKAPAKNKKQKSLRSLNDVLGKEAKAPSDSKVASLGSDKTARKVAAVISIFDDSSREGSENSQDDEQFKARREFLKSGLPESFIKQIAKTAATKEAFSLCSSDFQPVTHTTQPPKDEHLWNLPWPKSSQLFKLKDVWKQTPNHTSPVCGSLSVKTLPDGTSFAKRALGCRPEVSESNRHLLVEEVRTSNPEFPAQKFINCFLKRRTDYQQQLASESEAVGVTNTLLQSGTISGKRKRTNDGVEISVKEAKKQRSNEPELNLSTARSATNKRAGRSRRSRRSKSMEEDAVEDQTKPSLSAAPSSPPEEAVVILDDLEDDAGKKDVVREDVLWTDKYQPQHSSDIVGNAASVRRLHSWLKEWKLRADREERKKQKEKKQEVANSDSDWDYGDEDNAEDLLCNTMIITGPAGVGKTAAVYACAYELGFKVFEVNASSQRSGRLILSQLKEATQSHQVDTQGVNAHKPTYFNSYGASSGGSGRPGSSPRKGVSPRRVVASPRKNPQSPRASKKGNLAPTSLSNFFFKMGKTTNKPPPNNPKTQHSVSKGKEGKQKGSTVVKKKQSEEQAKKTATSLILFEEVDVIFEDDSGFLAAIKTFMTTTKRPVILTTSDPSFSSTFDGNFEEIHFDTPSLLNVSSYLQLLCLAEDTRTDGSDICALLRLNGCDIRQSLLQLQFWTRSSGGQPQHNKDNAEIKDKPLPLCESGCIQSKLGLLNIESERDVWELLKTPSLLEEKCWDLLSNSRQRGVDLLYCNMEHLLPLPQTPLTVSICKPEQITSVSEHLPPVDLQSESLQTKTRLLKTSEEADCSDSSPIKVSDRMRNKKRQHRKPKQEGLHSDSESDDGFLSLCKPRAAPQPEQGVKETSTSKRKERKTLTSEERAKSIPVSQSLQSIADFYENLSYIDSSLCLLHDESETNRVVSSVSVAIKDGMTDDSRIETNKVSRATRDSLFQIQGAVEALSFYRCRAAVGDAWKTSQQLSEEPRKEASAELSLPLAAHREGYTFTQDGLCQPQLVLQRRDVLESLMVKGVFGNLTTRSTAALDYLPIIRTICRSEKLKEQCKVKRRFLHYLDVTHWGLDKSTLQLLAKDFPQSSDEGPE